MNPTMCLAEPEVVCVCVVLNAGRVVEIATPEEEAMLRLGRSDSHKYCVFYDCVLEHGTEA